MRRRDVIRSGLNLGAAALGSGLLSAPRLARAQDAKTLRFIPQADAAILDPMLTTGIVNRNHGLLIFDTLYGADEQFKAQPQMVAGHTVSDDGKTWTMTLREGLKFHDGEPVRARDAVASLKRWGQRDAFAISVFGIVDELSAPDDKTIRWRLKSPFPLLPDALGKVGSICGFIMPERLANTDSSTPVKELVGSGPFRFRADQHVPGSVLVYERFAGYAPRAGAPSLLAGGKVANFDRVEWRVIPDPSTAAAALQRGEVDWWEQPIPDLLPTLKGNKSIDVKLLDTIGNVAVLRFNSTLPPFDNPAIRRAVLSAVDQRDFMQAIAGDDTSLWRDKVGFFLPSSPLASDVGMEALTAKRDVAAAAKAIKAAGYNGEKVLLMGAGDYPVINQLSEVAADLLRRLGFNLDYVVSDWGSVLRRMANRETPDKGGYNAFCTWAPGITHISPAAHSFLRGNGDKATFGWPKSPELEALRDKWLTATDASAQKAIGVEIQKQAFIDVPYVPLGLFFQPTAYRRDLTGFIPGPPLFWSVRRT